ncbi:MAG TPA: hypothetical protein VEU62_19135, partial [Bryobacterales bacterium]|nr:hypothetical protein [Bryobacterales bacterium]
MPNRRRFLQALSSLPFLGRLASASPLPGASGRRDYMQELKVHPFINAGEPYTTLTGSLMPPEVVEAIEYASKQYVRLN